MLGIIFVMMAWAIIIIHMIRQRYSGCWGLRPSRHSEREGKDGIYDIIDMHSMVSSILSLPSKAYTFTDLVTRQYIDY